MVLEAGDGRAISVPFACAHPVNAHELPASVAPERHTSIHATQAVVRRLSHRWDGDVGAHHWHGTARSDARHLERG